MTQISFLDNLLIGRGFSSRDVVVDDEIKAIKDEVVEIKYIGGPTFFRDWCNNFFVTEGLSTPYSRKVMQKYKDLGFKITLHDRIDFNIKTGLPNSWVMNEAKIDCELTWEMYEGEIKRKRR